MNVLDWYAQYIYEFLSIRSEFQSMWDDHLGCITTAKNRIELLKNRMGPVHSALYGPVAMTMKLKNVEM